MKYSLTKKVYILPLKPVFTVFRKILIDQSLFEL